jgi:hypothetical protein
VAAGIAVIVAASLAGSITVFTLWRRVPPTVAFAILSLSGMAVAAGGLIVQDDVGASSWVVALVAFAVLTPVHARLVFGPPGPRRGVVAPDAAAA